MTPARTVGVKLGTVPYGGAYPPDGPPIVPGELLWFLPRSDRLPGMLEREEPADTRGWHRVRVDRLVADGATVLVSHYP
jgi:hypothetical protein